MGWYQDKAFPKLMQLNIGKPSILQKRKSLLQRVQGNILEIGIGEGTNLPLYPNHITNITAIDAYPRKLIESSVQVSCFAENAMEMHFNDNTFDTVVSTFSLCSVENLEQVCAEVSRVLKPGGALLFLEHGSAQFRLFQCIQNAFNPLYNRYAYGCNITLTYKNEIELCGLMITDFQITHAPIYPRFLTGYLYQGVAVKPTGDNNNDEIDL